MVGLLLCERIDCYDVTSHVNIMKLTLFFTFVPADAIVHVVRCFEDEDVVHVDGSGR